MLAERFEQVADKAVRRPVRKTDLTARLADAQELVTKAHEKGLYVFFDGAFGHNKGNLVASPTGKLPVDSSPGFSNFSSQQTVDFYKEVATYWINQLGIDGWRLDQSYQVLPSAWRGIRGKGRNLKIQ